jgi:hypothetical protein
MQPPRAVPATQLSSSTRTLRHAPFTAQRPHLRGPAPCSAAAPNRRVLIEGAVASALLLVAKPAYADDEGIAAALEVEAAPVEAPVAAAVEEVAPAPVASSSARTGQTVRLRGAGGTASQPCHDGAGQGLLSALGTLAAGQQTPALKRWTSCSPPPPPPDT